MDEDDASGLERKLARGDFLKLGAGLAVGSSLLAACGSEDSAAPPPPASDGSSGSPAPAEPAPAAIPPIGEESGTLEILEWAGYEHPTYGGLDSYVDEFGKPKYTFLTSDDQALGKVRAGFKPDLVHPCVGYIPDWISIGAIQPFDPSLLTSFNDLNPSMVAAGQVDGKQYMVPAEWGFSSVLYRSDKVTVEEESWGMLYDERYAGKISWWESPVENFVIWGYFKGVDDPWNMSDEELEEGKSFLISKKKHVRNFWSSYTDLDADFKNGNVWVAYAWQDAWLTAKKNGLDVKYADPKEGRLSWLCGFVLAAETDNYRHAHEYVDTWTAVPSAEWILLNYAYGHANTQIDLDKLNPELVQAFKLDDPNVLEEPKTHIDRYVARRRDYAKAWNEVKAA